MYLSKYLSKFIEKEEEECRLQLILVMRYHSWFTVVKVTRNVVNYRKLFLKWGRGGCEILKGVFLRGHWGLDSSPPRICSHPFPPTDPETWPLLSVMSLLSPFISDLFDSLFLIWFLQTPAIMGDFEVDFALLWSLSLYWLRYPNLYSKFFLIN